MNAQARKPASKKPAPAKKAGKTGATPKAVAKKIVKKPVPAKAAAKPVKSVTPKPKPKASVVKKAAAPKAVAKKVVTVKPVAKKAATSKVAAKPVAKKAVKAAAPKPVAAKKAGKAAQKPAAAKKPVAKTVAVKAPAKAAVKPAVKVAPAAKKPKAEKVKTAKAAAPAKAVVAAPVVHVVPVIPGYTPVVHKKNSRAAKMAALVPPPPAAVVVTNAAKSSFMPMTAPSVPSIVPVIPQKDAKLANNWKSKTADQLTDAEVIAMPDSEYMNDIQMAFFRLKLSKLKDEVLSNASETTEHLREDTVVTPDPADRATIEEEHALELRTRDRERKLLKKIEQSINRIDAGDYGYCDETGEAIGVGRLLARPTATLSLEAQERRELKQKMFGD
ncbi:RNA polymerase-binding protein DksA [Limnohabitans sp. JirII-29]|uniref:RNA polymerase-binding protein DksA n=1 Tax=Limnohabitans sp. JirII-29 TaxID=1835756 RepID=UPI000D3BCF4D|nr:RNA polymerase-binding protein DksA [Limnohabitans sp. JirII-29]